MIEAETVTGAWTTSRGGGRNSNPANLQSERAILPVGDKKAHRSHFRGVQSRHVRQATRNLVGHTRNPVGRSPEFGGS